MTRALIFMAALDGDISPFDFLHTMQGPDFLIAYLAWFGLTFCAVLVLRAKGFDNALTNLGGLAIFLGLGIARIVVGSAHGLQKWEFLIVMMSVGSLCFLARPSRASNGSSSTGGWWSSCSTGGGCGSGGCGGGGCGGCGGG